MRTIVKILLFLSVFSLSIFSGDYYFPYIVSKVFPFRFFIELATIVWLINVFWTRTLHFKFSEPIVKAILVFSGALLASTLFGVNPMFSFWSNFERSEGLFSFLHYLAFFVLLVDVFREDDYYRLIKFFLLLSPLISYYGVSDFVTANSHQYGRAFGVFGNPSYLACFLIFMFGLGALLILRNIEFSRVLKDPLLIAENVLWVVILLGNIPAFLLTQTRGAYIGLLVGVFVFLVFLLRKGVGVQRKYAIGGLALFISLVVVAGFVIFQTKLAPANLSDPSTMIFRFATWGSAWKSFLDRPFFGYGMENFSVGFDKHYNPIHSGVEIWFDHAHSVIFDTLASTGLFGIISYLAIFVVLFYFYLPIIARRRPVVEAGIFFALPVAYFVQNLVLFDTLSSYVLFFLFLGVVRATFLKETSKDNKEKTFFASHFVIAGCVITVLIIGASFAMYANVNAYQRNIKLRENYTLARQSSLNRAVGLYQDLSEMPGYLGRREVMKDFISFLYEWSSRNDFKSLSKDDGDALSFSLMAVNDFLQKESGYSHAYYLAGNLYNLIAVRSGSPDALHTGESILKSLNLAAPDHVEIIGILVDNLINQKKYDEALPYALQMITLRPDMEVGHRTVGFVYTKIGKNDEAKKEKEEALRINPSSTAAAYLKKTR